MTTGMIISVAAGAIATGAVVMALTFTPVGQQFQQYVQTRTISGPASGADRCLVTCPDGRQVQKCVYTQTNQGGNQFVDLYFFRDPCSLYEGQCVFDNCPPGANCGAPQVIDCADPSCNSGPCRPPQALPPPPVSSGDSARCGIDACLGRGPLCSAPTQLVDCADPKCNTGPCTTPPSSSVRCGFDACAGFTGPGPACLAPVLLVECTDPRCNTGPCSSSTGQLIQRTTSYPNQFPNRPLPTFEPVGQGTLPVSSGVPSSPLSTLPSPVASTEPLTCAEGEVMACPECAPGTPAELCACRCVTVPPATSAPVPSPEKKEPIPPPPTIPAPEAPEVAREETTVNPVRVVFTEGLQRITSAFQRVSGLVGQGLEALSNLLFERE